MKISKIILSILLVTCSICLTAQSVPMKFKYQGVAKFNNTVVSGDISLQVTILEGSPQGSVVFQERHTVQTNADGVFATEVGGGDTVEGNINTIDWSTGTYFLKAEMDPEGGIDFLDMGWSQLVSVPYALHAGTVDDKDDADADPMNELQDLGYDSLTNELTLTEGNTVKLPYPGKDDQTLTLEGTNLEIEDGNSVDFFELLSNVDDADADPTNELQNWGNLPGIPADLMDGDDVNDADSDPLNEIQSWEDIPNIPPELLDGDNVDDADSDPRNELQKLQWQINNTPWSDEWVLQLIHEEIDPGSGSSVIVIDSFVTIPDSDPINECQRLSIMPDLDDPSNSKLEILKKECVVDSAGNTLTVWVPFGDPAIIEDTDSTNELQTLTFDPNTNEVEISGGNKINLTDLRTPWVVSPSPSDDCIEYDGKATSGSFETTEGAVLIDDTGISRYYIPTGENTSNMCLENMGNSTWGKLETLNNGELVGNFQSCIHSSGIVDIYGPNGNYNVIIGHEDGLPNNGRVGVVNTNNIEVAGFYVNNLGQGVSFADIKNFKMDHPADATKEIWYASLEGPEAGAYERGTSQLEGGEIFVSFSDHFSEVINPKSMTVMLTPLSANTLGLAVVEKTAVGFRVKELMEGKGNFEFDWEVKSVRKSYENYQPIRKKRNQDFTHTKISKEK